MCDLRTGYLMLLGVVKLIEFYTAINNYSY
jgi:hypothetical protein